MAKTATAEVLEMETGDEKVTTKTPKSILKSVEKVVRRMDGVVSDLDKLVGDVQSVEGTITTEIHPKDQDRLEEISEVLEAARGILYHLTARMARKYVGKEIATCDGTGKRKVMKSK